MKQSVPEELLTVELFKFEDWWRLRVKKKQHKNSFL